jgi:hypothetical protein
MTQQEWLQLARSVRSVYLNNNEKMANKNKLLHILEAFEALYNIKTSPTNNDKIYLSNLIQTGIIEGTYEEITGTVTSQLKQTIDFIKKPTRNIFCNQASYFSENLLNCLQIEEFNFQLDPVLAPFKQSLDSVANGNY